MDKRPRGQLSSNLNKLAEIPHLIRLRRANFYESVGQEFDGPNRLWDTPR